VGHWEGDSVIGAVHKQAIVKRAERKCGFVLLAKLFNKSADLVVQANEAKHKSMNTREATLTVVDCKEFAYHQLMDHSFSIQTYFANPYCSWQRGRNENFIGLLRQYIPKKRRMVTVLDEEMTMIENRLNQRPRKQLGSKTPHEASHASLNCVVVCT
jgi:IS30 family transposase